MLGLTKSNDLKIRLRALLGINEGLEEQRQPLDEHLENKKTCHCCPKAIKRNTFYICRECYKLISNNL